MPTTMRTPRAIAASTPAEEPCRDDGDGDGSTDGTDDEGTGVLPAISGPERAVD